MSDGWVKEGSWRRKVLDYDPHRRCTTHYYFHEGTMKQRLVETYDIDHIIEANKAVYAQTDERAPYNGMTQVGRIPISIAFDVLKKTGWGKDRKAVSRWLRDPDNRFFLTRPVSLGV